MIHIVKTVLCDVQFTAQYFNAHQKLQAEACFSLQHGHYSNPATPNLHTQRTENKTTDMVIQQHSRKLLMMAILMSQTC